ncbi:MarR family winged helix-turn-helix transcriptional regulator [Polaromonas sp. UC242_47]|uniref:MarR family winged helix-turn-helix transcriptional regulator n=1 Tax=Polaromonas sp. UC242_47 TaxID=3374626 RepID=UPI0037A5AF07
MNSLSRLDACQTPHPTVPAFHILSQLYARPGFLLRRAHQISAAVFEDECRNVGLTPAQFGVLSVLRASPGLDQSSLARALGFDKVTVLRVLRGLETRGLIARAPAPASRRNLSISLSAEGLSLLKQAQEPAERAYHRLMAPLNKEQQTQFVDLLQLLTAGLESEARAAFVPPGQDSSEEKTKPK